MVKKNCNQKLCDILLVVIYKMLVSKSPNNPD